MSYSVPLNLVVVLSFIIFVFYILGIHNILTNLGENDCDMTYMFEFPQFVEISLPAKVHQSYPRYALYGYSEGGHTEKLRQMKFRGIPVLFIPGSSGSYKQGRSLASVSLRKALNSRTPFYFDYFMVDFSGDQSAVYGGVLDDEVKFVRHCITKILTFYSKELGNEQTSVILIGHSLGGIISKAVFLDPHFNKETVQLIITLSSPLKYPVIQPDPYFASFYKNIESTWKNGSLANVTLISIGGGRRDVLVRSDLTIDVSADINVLSSAIPGVWCSTDHLSVLWCKQLVLTVVRAMFDSIDLNTKQLTVNENLRLKVWKYHLLRRSAGKRFATNQHTQLVSFDREAKWIENMLTQFTVLEPKGTKTNNFIMIRLYQDSAYEIGFIETFNLNIKDWIYVCSANAMYKSVRICENGLNLSNMTEIAPVPPLSKLKRKFVYLNLAELKTKNFTHVIINVPRLENYVQVNVDVHSVDERIINWVVPSMYSVSKKTILKQTVNNSIYYRINLVGFDTIWQAFSFGIEVISCKTSKNNALLSFIIPWASQHYHFHMLDKKSISATLTLFTSKPGDTNKGTNPFARLNLDPTCSYRITIKPSVIGSASQIALYFTGALPAYIIAVLLLTVRQQEINLRNGESVFFHNALCSAVRRYYLILQATILGSKLFGLGVFLQFLPKPDFFKLEDLNMDFFFMSIMLYGLAIVIIYSLGIACYVSVVVSGKAAHKMALKFFAKTVTGFVNWSEWLVSVLHQVPILVSAILVSLALSTSGALALTLGAIFYFLKICNMYEEYQEDIFHYSIKFIAEKVKNLTNKRKSNSNDPDKKTNSDVVIMDDIDISEKSETRGTNGSKPPESDNATLQESHEEENVNEDGASFEEAKSASEVVSKPVEQESLDECEKSLEPIQPDENPKEVGLLSAINFHVTLFLLWSCVAILHIPSLLVWAKNYHHSVFLERDPAVIPSLILNACGAVLWQCDVPYPSGKMSRIISSVLFFLAAVSIIYASVSIYRLSYIISAAMILLTINQAVTKFFS